MGAHGAVASFFLGEAVTQAVLEDWRGADVPPKLRAGFAIVEQLVARPETFDAGSVARAREAGLSDAAIRDVGMVCGLFCMIVRIADTLAWEVPVSFESSRGSLVKFGYRLPPFL